MLIDALQIGSAFKEELSRAGILAANVRGIFNKVINLELETNSLVSIVSEDILNAPNNLVVTTPPAFSLKELGINLGAEVKLTPREISFEKAGFRIDLSEVEVWTSNLSWEGLAVESGILAENLEFLKKIVVLEGAHEGLGELAKFAEQIVTGRCLNCEFDYVSELLYSVVFSLVKAVLIGEQDLIAKNSKRLLGLGPGLTPAGDDFLLGFYTMLVLLEQRTKLVYLTQEIKDEILTAAEAKTTLESRTMLRYVLEAQVPEIILKLLASLFTTEETEVFCNTLRLLDRGSTSGTDIATGILIGGYTLLTEL
ncbi:DUF2877 domain-containing protein [Fuchsiella alkaliacetigena]|uniref:DUF2877 domain-containing protein n=1 Tax=Fuchsiella alkaliacetigena TaxID=957042 RepID=UPI002009F9BB|nr:DUF2877 domain-containing protein [Fuchsiella alkaliacetigena]MCK8825617.1 DUF2877 domain-containing protein [Fuchsiella alkaliacetigena]